MQELTTSQDKVLAELKTALLDKETLNKIITANYLISEIYFQFGCDVAEFVIGYQNGVLQNNIGFTSGEIPLLSKAGDYTSSGYGEFFHAVNGLMCDIDNKTQVNVHSKEAKDFSGAVNNLFSCEKTPWIDNYNKAKSDGIIK